MDSRVSSEDVIRLGVTVRIPPSLRSLTDGQDEVVVECADLAALLRSLDGAFPGLRERIVNELGRTRPYVNVFVNDELVRAPLPEVRLRPGDVVHILPSVAGGSIG